MFMIFFRSMELELIHMIEPGHSIPSAYYKNFLESLLKTIQRQKPKSNLHTIKLHHDNAKSYHSNDIKTLQI